MATDSTLEQVRHDYQMDDVATRRDLKELELILDHKIKLLRADTARLIAESRADLTRWIIGAVFFANSLDYRCVIENRACNISLILDSLKNRVPIIEFIASCLTHVLLLEHSAFFHRTP